MKIFRGLSLVGVVVAVSLPACDVSNSTSGDALAFGGGAPTIDTSTPDGQRFAAFHNVIEEVCVSCHTSNEHAGWASLGEQDWIRTGLISPGNAAGSALFQKLSVNGGDMPLQGSLTSAQVADISDWINGASALSPIPIPPPTPSPPIPPPSTDASRFQAAQAVFAKSCVACHATFATMTEAQWVSNGYVVAGNLQSSLVLSELQNNGGKMPMGGAPLSTTDLDTLEAWIQQLILP